MPGLTIPNSKQLILKNKMKRHQKIKRYTNAYSGINIGLRLLIFGLFSRGYVLIREGNAYFFSKYPLFDGMEDAYFKGYA